MPRILNVRIGDTPVGTLANIAGDTNLFVFAESYVDDPKRPILSQSFLSNGAPGSARQTHRVAPPFFANLLPEERTLLRSFLARQHNLNPTRDFPFLRVLGGDLPGNVILDVAAEDDVSSDVDTRGADLDVDLAKAADDMPPMRFSLAGVQMKFSATMKAQQLTVPASGNGGNWIVKLPNERYPYLTENEAATMNLARELGFDVPATQLLPLHDIAGIPEELHHLGPAFAIARFDRPAAGGRMHFEDLCQVAGLPPAEKYETKNMEWVWGAVARLCPSNDADDIVRRFTFGAIVGNDDMHLKNWSITYPDGRSARLAPLYDFLPTKRYTNSTTMALALGGDRRWERLTWEHFIDCARAADLRTKRAVAAAAETIERFRERWPAARETFVDPVAVRIIDTQLRTVPMLAALRRR